jgi:hypothetical protein
LLGDGLANNGRAAANECRVQCFSSYRVSNFQSPK